MTDDADPVDPIVARMTRSRFDVDRRSEVLALLEAYDGPEATRVRLALLKLADGDLDRLRDGSDLARIDYRDVLAAAEYPRQMAHAPADLQAMPDEERQAIEAADRQEYVEWLASAEGA